MKQGNVHWNGTKMINNVCDFISWTGADAGAVTGTAYIHIEYRVQPWYGDKLLPPPKEDPAI